jgi:hypothetical protein
LATQVTADFIPHPSSKGKRNKREVSLELWKNLHWAKQFPKIWNIVAKKSREIKVEVIIQEESEKGAGEEERGK